MPSNSQLNELIGSRIRERRLAMQLTREDLAEKPGVDISPRAISMIEMGVEVPSFEVLLKLCNVLDSSPTSILLGDISAPEFESIFCKLKLLQQYDSRYIQTVEKIISVFIETLK